jgi:DUF1680 family protein
LLLLSCTPGREKQVRDYPIVPVDFTHVQLNEGFWKDRVETAIDVTIPFSFRKCEETGRINNFIYAGGIKEGKFEGDYGFNDSDVYKIMEGAAYALMLEKDPALEAYLDSLVYYVAAAQEDDGYLYTAWTLNANEYNDFKCCSYSDEGRFVALDGSHELYNPGHMYEAAVAHHLATGRHTFLDVATKHADLLYDLCMVQGNRYMPGHQEIEIGLAKLYRVTGDPRYLELAKYFLDIRGVGDNKKSAYNQAHMPVTEQREAVGHAVRANYMYAAMADVAALSGDSSYLEAIDHIWEDMATTKLSVTGGVGASHRGEAYGAAYDLPNDPYNETCAAIANVYWNHRMFLLHGDSKYIDVLERALYNGVLSGISLQGDLFFYPNTLRFDGEATFNRGHAGRAPWFDCSCCPSNLARFIPSVAGYAYAARGSDVYVNLFMNSEAVVETDKGLLRIAVDTDYPWSGDVRINIEDAKPQRMRILIRVPGWAAGEPVPTGLFAYTDAVFQQVRMSVNGEQIAYTLENGYAVLDRKWQKGDQIGVALPMAVRKVVAHPKVEAKLGLVALEYGPMVYCAEQIDNTMDVLDAGISDNMRFGSGYDAGLLQGVNMLSTPEGLLNLIPYYAWNNRGTHRMNVWFKHN